LIGENLLPIAPPFEKWGGGDLMLRGNLTQPVVPDCTKSSFFKRGLLQRKIIRFRIF
jgi:hypothetical protein